ncbi:MAG: hypothetical protein AAF790_02505 [Planctomycetota bacterium]
MALSWSPTGDFTAAQDGGEPVTLYRRGSAATVPIGKAVRSRQRVAEHTPSGGRVSAADAAWEFELPDSEAAPGLGDRIIEASGQCWTVLTVEPQRAASRVRCQTRNLTICHRLEDRVSVQSAEWEDTGSGPQIVAWKTTQVGVPARVQHESTVVDRSGSQPTSTATHKIFVLEGGPFDHNHRLVGSDGRVFAIDRYAGAAQIDGVATIDVTEEGGV